MFTFRCLLYGKYTKLLNTYIIDNIFIYTIYLTNNKIYTYKRSLISLCQLFR